MKLRNEQTGFSVVEVLLVLIFLAVIGFAGYYVYNNQKSTKTTDSTATTSTKAPNNTKQTAYLTVKEWGVKLPLGSDIKAVTYKVSTDSTGQSIDLYIPSSECTPMSTIVRGKASDNDPTTNPDGEGTYQTYQNSPNSKHVGDYYYSKIDGNGMDCFKGEPQTTVDGVSMGATTYKVRSQIADAFKGMALSAN